MLELMENLAKEIEAALTEKQISHEILWEENGFRIKILTEEKKKLWEYFPFNKLEEKKVVIILYFQQEDRLGLIRSLKLEGIRETVYFFWGKIIKEEKKV
jgi:hypothetical protein